MLQLVIWWYHWCWIISRFRLFFTGHNFFYNQMILVAFSGDILLIYGLFMWFSLPLLRPNFLHTHTLTHTIQSGSFKISSIRWFCKWLRLFVCFIEKFWLSLKQYSSVFINQIHVFNAHIKYSSEISFSGGCHLFDLLNDTVSQPFFK